MHLHMTQFDGTTFGMSVNGNSPAFRRMKKNIFTADVKLHSRCFLKKMRCVKSKDLAAVMCECGWQITEKKCMETVQWDGSDEHYIDYSDTKEDK